MAHVATWVIAGLWDRTFHTVPELAEAIGERMDAYNREPFQKRPGSRLEVSAAEVCANTPPPLSS